VITTRDEGASRDEPTERVGDRGQLVLIAAISIAFILLGVVVVFNGVLYTQTVSSSSSDQSLSEPSVIELEVEDAVCAVADEDGTIEPSDEDRLEVLYTEAGSASGSSVVSLDLNEQDGEEEGEEDIKYNAEITYTKSDLEFEKTITVDPEEDCPDEEGGE